MTKYTHLFEPIQIGNTTVKNRVFMPPISTNLADKGYVTEELIQHYAARAKGGVGLIISEVVTVEPTYIYLPGDMSIYDDSFVEGWTKLFAEVHKYGTKLLPQLFHPAYMAFPIPGTPQLIAPSNVGPYYAKSAPRTESDHPSVWRGGISCKTGRRRRCGNPCGSCTWSAWWIFNASL